MVVTEANTGGGHCGWALTSSCPGPQALLPFEDVALLKESDWITNRVQQQLLWDTLQSLKDKAAQAFLPFDAGQPVDPFKETYNDGGLYGCGCNYAVGFHGIQGRQPKCEDYVLHLALGPNLFAPFDDCTRACLACVLDGHGGTGAVQYVAERFPAYLLADLPRLRAQPAAAMRSALHRIDEELTALGHNSGTTVNALLLIDNRVTVINTGDCRCILYDWVDERAVQVTQDHNLLSTRERERVLGEGAELSGCGGYVVLPCPTDGAKLLGVTKALGHAGVKALQRSYTMGSLSGILETELSSGLEAQRPLVLSPGGGAVRVPIVQAEVVACAGAAAACAVEAATSLGPSAPARPASSQFSSSSLWSDRTGECGVASSSSTAGAISGSGMSEDSPVLPQEPAAGASGDSGQGLPDVDMCGGASCALAETCQSCHGMQGSAAAVDDNDGRMERRAAVAAVATALTLPGMATQQQLLQPRGTGRGESRPIAVPCLPAVAVDTGSDASVNAVNSVRQGSGLPLERCSGTGICSQAATLPSQPQQQTSSFATAAAMALATAVAADPPDRSATAATAARASAGLADCLAAPGLLATPLAGMSMSSGSGFLLTCEPDEFEFTIEDDRHLVLLGCDGVFDRMNNSEACKTALRQLTASNSCVDAAREVTHRACRLGSCDNITALVLRFGRKPIVRRQSFSVLSLRRSSSNTSGDLAASGGSISSTRA